MSGICTAHLGPRPVEAARVLECRCSFAGKLRKIAEEAVSVANSRFEQKSSRTDPAMSGGTKLHNLHAGESSTQMSKQPVRISKSGRSRRFPDSPD